MARPKRKKIKFGDEDSVNALLQEIYNDSHNIKAKINRLFTKWEAKAKGDDDIAILGQSIVKLIDAESKTQDQKITLLRYLKEVAYAKDRGNTTEDTGTVTSDGRQEIIRLAKEAMKNEGKV